MVNRRILIGLAIFSFCFSGYHAAADQRELIVTLGAREEYNDNIFFTFEDEIDDFITTLSGGLKFNNLTERSTLRLSGILERLIYAKENDLDATDQYYSGYFGYKITPRFNVSAQAAYTMDSRPDRDVAATGLLLSTVPRQVQIYGGSADYALTEITTADAFYRYTKQTFEPRSNISSFQDYSANRAGLGFTRRLDQYFTNTLGRLNFGYNYFSYPESGTDNTVYSGTVGLERELTELWRVLIDLGPAYYESKFKTVDGDVTNRGWSGTGLITLSYRGEYTVTNFRLFHGIEPASGREGSAQRTSAVFDVLYRFAERGRVGLLAGYYINKADAGDLARRDIDEDTINLRPRLIFDITDKLYLEAAYTYSRIKDKVIDDNRSRNLVWLQLVFDYPVIE